MYVELVGCTSAGKTTLARKMVEVGKELGVDVQLSDDFLLQCIRLNWIKNEFVRRRVIELWALLVNLVSWSRYRALHKLILRICCTVPGSWLYRFNLLRVVLRKIGIYEIIRRRSSDAQWVLLDNEGMLQASHTLFVHSGGTLNTGKLADFLELIPLSDVIAYVRQSEPLLIERTSIRGHNRLPEGAKGEAIAPFIRQAVLMFEEIRRYPRFTDRLLVIDGMWNTLLNGEYNNNPAAIKTASIVLAGLSGDFPANHRVSAENALDSKTFECVFLNTSLSEQ